MCTQSESLAQQCWVHLKGLIMHITYPHGDKTSKDTAVNGAERALLNHNVLYFFPESKVQ